MQTNTILQLVSDYCKNELGYKKEIVEKEFSAEMYSELVAIKLANANVVNKNKRDNSSHQSHIAITGESIYFFFTKEKFDDMSSDDDAITIKILLLDSNIENLRNKKALNVKDEILKFSDGIVSVGKRTQNQVQLSKSRSSNSDNFNELRDGLFEGDLLVMLKRRNDGKIIFLGLKEEIYNKYIENYDLKFNSNTHISLDDVAPAISSDSENSSNNGIHFNLYTEKDADNDRFCYFCGTSLENYMRSLPANYRDNDIQRGIVKNVYLDRLVRTIVSKDNIPTITLVADKVTVCEGGRKIEVDNYRILDGLQRTYRLQEIWKCMKLFEELQNKDELVGMNKIKLSRVLGPQLQEQNCDLSVFSEIVKEYQLNGNIERFWQYYCDNEQWFEVWENLTFKQETDKMLILNAGHREMNIRHQLELLFLNDLPILTDLCKKYGGSKIIRNKEKSDMLYSKERVKGEFYFSHLISAAVSYVVRKPITTNSELLNKIQEDNIIYENDISFELLEKMMKFLVIFDKALYDEYGGIGVNWLSKETVLVGLFAALGEALKEKGVDAMQPTYLWNVKGLNINSYEKCKNDSIDVSKVNVGNVTKSAVRMAIFEYLTGKIDCINWNDYFGGKYNDAD